MADVRGRLALESGATYEGVLFGAPLEHAHNGEVVFNTCMSGYQEVITDPSYAGQVVVMTYPLIGNYGCRDDTAESSRVQCRALVVRELSADIGHARGERTLEEELRRNGIPGLREVDTRALTRHLRDHGTLRGVIAVELGGVRRRAGGDGRSAPFVSDEDLVGMVSIDEPFRALHGAARSDVAPRGCALRERAHGSRPSCRRARLRREAEPGSRAVQPRCRGHPRPSGRAASRTCSATIPTGSCSPTVRAIRRDSRTPSSCAATCSTAACRCSASASATRSSGRLPAHPRRVSDSDTTVETTRSATPKTAPSTSPHRTTSSRSTRVASRGFRAGTSASATSTTDRVEGLRHRELPAFSVQYHPEGAPGPQDRAVSSTSSCGCAFGRQGGIRLLRHAPRFALAQRLSIALGRTATRTRHESPPCSSRGRRRYSSKAPRARVPVAP